MISTAAASEARAKIVEALDDGATLLTGGEQSGPLLAPAVLTGVVRTCRLWEEGVFAPVVIVEPFDDEMSTE